MKTTRTLVRIAALTALLIGLTACGATPTTPTQSPASASADTASNARATLAYVDPRASYKPVTLKPAGAP